jgi:hypothetical protein
MYCRRSRRAEVEVAPLESRALLSNMSTSPSTSAAVSPITITETVSPQTLWPPNGRFVPVHVSGTVTDSDTRATLDPSITYTVFDSETGTQIRMGTATLDSQDDYSFHVSVQARRSGHDFNGRQYTISVMATDSDKNTASDSAVVTVPHDQGNHGGNGESFGGGEGLFSGGTFSSRRFFTGNGGGGGSANLHFGGPGQGQSNSISVPGSNNTITQNITNTQSNTYNITNNITNTTTNNVTTPAPVVSPASGNTDQSDEGGDGSDNGSGNGHDHGHGNGDDGNQDNGNQDNQGNGNGNGNNKHGGS